MDVCSPANEAATREWLFWRFVEYLAAIVKRSLRETLDENKQTRSIALTTIYR